MKKVSVKIGFTRFTNAGLATKAREILGKMEGNKNFPDPSPRLEDIQKQADAYNAALAALDGTRLKTMIRDKERKALESMLHLLGLYVLQHGEDDEAILETSGYDLVRLSQHAGSNVRVTGFTVKGNAGTASMELSCNRVKNARAYMFQSTLAPITANSQWTVETDTKASHVFEHLIPGEQYCFRMAAIVTGSKQVFSDVISRIL